MNSSLLFLTINSKDYIFDKNATFNKKYVVLKYNLPTRTSIIYNATNNLDGVDFSKIFNVTVNINGKKYSFSNKNAYYNNPRSLILRLVDDNKAIVTDLYPLGAVDDFIGPLSTKETFQALSSNPINWFIIIVLLIIIALLINSSRKSIFGSLDEETKIENF